MGLGTNLRHLGRLARADGDYRRARVLHEECVVLGRQAGGRWLLSGALADLGAVTLVEGDTARAQALFEEALAVARELGAKTRFNPA